MQRLRVLILLAATFVLASLSSAFADHMTGRYSGTGEAAGVILSLQQSGGTVSGQLSGADQGTLNGQQNGENSFQGVLSSSSMGRANISGTWSQDALHITLNTGRGSFNYMFVPEGSGSNSGNTVTLSLGDGGENAQYYYVENGAQAGPVPFAELRALIESGTLTRSTLVWTPGQGDWQRADAVAALASLFPPEPPQLAQYYAAEGNQQIGPLSLEELIGRIEAGETGADDLVWKSGLESWAPALTFPELADALSGPPALPDTPPELTPEAPEQQDGPPALPGAGGPQAPGAASQTDDQGESAALLEQLRPLFVAVYDEQFPGGDAAARDEFARCSLEALSVLSVEDLRLAVETGLDFSSEDVERLKTTYPGIEATTSACETVAAVANGGGESGSSAISLADGRMVEVIANGSVSMSATEGGVDLEVNGTRVSFLNGVLTVDGEEREVPEFANTLTLDFSNGELEVRGR